MASVRMCHPSSSKHNVNIYNICSWILGEKPSVTIQTWMDGHKRSFATIQLFWTVTKNKNFSASEILKRMLRLLRITTVSLLTSLCLSPNQLNFSAIGIFGAFFLLLLIVSDVIPQALTSIPVYGVYLLINMTLVVLAMFFNALVSSLHDRPEQKEIPQCLKWVSK